MTIYLKDLLPLEKWGVINYNKIKTAFSLLGMVVDKTQKIAQAIELKQEIQKEIVGRRLRSEVVAYIKKNYPLYLSRLNEKIDPLLIAADIAIIYDDDKLVKKILIEPFWECDCYLMDQKITPFQMLALNGCLSNRKKLLDLAVFLLKKGVNIDNCQKNGFSLLHIASKYNFVDLAEFLISNGSDIYMQVQGSGSEGGMKPIHLAAKYCSIDVLKLLLKKGAKIDEMDGLGKTPMYYAVQKDHDEIVSFLLENKADIHFCLPGEGAYLHVAAQYNSKKAAEILIKNGIDIHRIQEESELNALIKAIVNKNYDFAKFLLDEGADINQRFKEGITALYIFAANNNYEAVKFLLENKANFMLGCKRGVLPSDVAIFDNNIEIYKLLIEHGYNVNREVDDLSDNDYYKAMKNHSFDVLILIESYDGGFGKKLLETRLLLHIFSIEGNDLFEGISSLFSYIYFGDLISKYLSYIKTKGEMIKIIDALLYWAILATNDSDFYYSRWEKGEAVVLNAGWAGKEKNIIDIESGHAISITIYDKYLIFGNRGARTIDIYPKAGITVYEIGNFTKMKEAIEKIVFYSRPPGNKSEALKYLEKGLNEQLKLKQVYFEEKKDQKIGNCATLAPFLATRAIFILNEIKKNPSITIKEAAEKTRQIYKKVVSYIRWYFLIKLKGIEQTEELKKYINFNDLYLDLALKCYRKEDRLDMLDYLIEQNPKFLKALHSKTKRPVLPYFILQLADSKNPKSIEDLIIKCLEKGAAPMSREESVLRKDTPIELAIEAKNIKIVKALVQAGAKVDKRILEYAKKEEYYNEEVYKFLSSGVVEEES